MKHWKEILAESITDTKRLKKLFDIDKRRIDKVVSLYPMKINSYYLSLIKRKGDPIWKQCMPSVLETQLSLGRRDPLKEKKYSPIPGMIHRYPGKVLLAVSDMCAGYCRFCTRKRNIGTQEKVLRNEYVQRAFRYITKHKSVRDIIISGGDPLMLSDDRLEYYLKTLRKIKHVEIVRIHSRMPCVLPQRITPKLCRILKKYSPIYFNTHFNHYQEITRQSRRACNMLADSGIILGNQTVLLAGVNDNARVLKRLFEGLLTMRVRPYYLYIPDAVRGTYHFRVSIAKALRIMRKLIGYTSGLAIPQLILDLKRGGGKIPLLPNYITKHQGKRYNFKNFENKSFYYADVA